MIHTVDNQIHVIYPLNYDEDQIQGLIHELSEVMNSQQNDNLEIYINNNDIAISLLFYLKNLLETKPEITMYFKEEVFNTIRENFQDTIFNSDKLKVN